jgi:beta-glucosidase
MKKTILAILCLAAPALLSAQQSFTQITASVYDTAVASRMADGEEVGLVLAKNHLRVDQRFSFALARPGELTSVTLDTERGASVATLSRAVEIRVTYDPMNPGEAIDCRVGETASPFADGRRFVFEFPAKYGAHLIVTVRGGVIRDRLALREVSVGYAAATAAATSDDPAAQIWRNPELPVEQRVEAVLAAMTPADKMELLREGWGIPGIPRLGIPFMNKVESLHGFSYGSGATIFPQVIGMAASWDKALVGAVGSAIGAETAAAGTLQGWSPVLDVAQDPRWGRMEETYGEDPVMVAKLGSAWVEGFQSQGLITTPKHFGGHGAPLGGRDSHDIGLSEREMREIHLAPFRHVIKQNDCQSLMMAYSDWMGVPIAKSHELLVNILREEWGFDGYVVSDCGAIGNLTSRKHYTATNPVEAANQALGVMIATNCGDTYNNKEVIAAAADGRIDMKALDNTCRTLLRVIFRGGYFDTNPARPLDWNKVYDGWNTPEHRELAREAARRSIVLLENRDGFLPLSKTTPSIAVIGPGSDDLQPGDYTPKLKEGQLKSVLTGIRTALPSARVEWQKGCEFTGDDTSGIAAAVEAARRARVAVVVLGDLSGSETTAGRQNTSGENHDWATLRLPGVQQQLLEAVCATGTPVVLVLQSGRPFNISWAAGNCSAVVACWLPGQEGGHAVADVLLGDYNPAGRLPVTFPAEAGQLPLYYNFKTSGRRYEYSDIEYYPLYRFGHGLSYTTFEYSDLDARELADGNIAVAVTVTNTGSRAGDEVVQLYLTDMYASVKTRVVELKDFARVHLAAGASRRVAFELTPYEFSLLNDKMDRVVESGEFKVCVGGTSPAYIAADRIKDSVGYPTAAQGLSTMLDYGRSFAASFDIAWDGSALVVTNSGTLTDIGRATLYIDGANTGETHHWELAPGESRRIAFAAASADTLPAPGEMTFTTKYKTLTVKR